MFTPFDHFLPAVLLAMHYNTLCDVYQFSFSCRGYEDLYLINKFDHVESVIINIMTQQVCTLLSIRLATLYAWVLCDIICFSGVKQKCVTAYHFSDRFSTA